MDKEKQIKAIMKDLECTREEAEEVFILEQKVKQNGTDKIYAQADKPKAKSTRAVMPDADKLKLIKMIGMDLENKAGIFNFSIVNPQREISFIFNGNEYSLTITKHRKRK